MIDARLLATYDADTDKPLDVWSYWIPRSGDNVILAIEVVHNSGVDISVRLYQKNYHEVGDGVDAGVGVSYSGFAAGIQTFEKIGAKELIRAKISVLRSASLPSTDSGTVLFRVLEPVWFESVKV